jgi:mannose/cellobiose epimerase-like protein (N-acyl-D-glucosamine 2-epimerase family)
MGSARPWTALGTGIIVAMTVGGAAEGAPKHAVGAALAPTKTITYLEPGPATYLELADEMDASLLRDVLGVWFPRSIDEVNGGFRSDFGRDWTPPPRSGGKFSVFQGRMTWIAAQVTIRRPELKEQYLPYVRRGVDFLSNVMWDKQDGGFYWGLDDKGGVSPLFNNSDGKHLYGIAFCIYGAAAAYEATKDPKALDLAQRGFRWADEHAHDAKNGGYHEWLTRAGEPVEPDPDFGFGPGAKPSAAPFPPGFKSMNTHIHLLEAFAQLYTVWKDDTLRQRLEELLTIVREKVSVEPGVMNLYFTLDWRPIPDHDSYGHDVEAGYLMLEAEDALGVPHDPRTERMARLFVDHALAFGWDTNLGGFYRDGTTFGPAEDRQKEWWVEFEGLNALLLMHDKYDGGGDRYFKAFQHQWQFIKDYQIDAQDRGVYEMIGADGRPTNPGKGRIWKAAYHDGRAFLNVTEHLRRLAKTAAR